MVNHPQGPCRQHFHPFSIQVGIGLALLDSIPMQATYHPSFCPLQTCGGSLEQIVTVRNKIVTVQSSSSAKVRGLYIQLELTTASRTQTSSTNLGMYYKQECKWNSAKTAFL